MPSLKSILPQIGKVAGISAATLYERQRELVRRSLLTAPVGRGPGKGTQVNVETVSALLTAVLLTDNLSDLRDVPAKIFRTTHKRVRSAILSRTSVAHDYQHGPVLINRMLPFEMMAAVAKVAEIERASA